MMAFVEAPYKQHVVSLAELGRAGGDTHGGGRDEVKRYAVSVRRRSNVRRHRNPSPSSHNKTPPRRPRPA